MKIIFLITPRYLVTEIVLQTFYNGVKKKLLLAQLYVFEHVIAWPNCYHRLTRRCRLRAIVKEMSRRRFCVAIWRQKAKNHLKDLFIL